jgi:hypothetical protein
MRFLSPIALLTPTVASAHPGDHGQTSWLHALTQPDHLLPVALVAIAGIVAYRLWARK